MMNSYKATKANPLMLSNSCDKISSLMTKGYRDKGNLLILNDFKIYEGKALMINSIKDEKRHPP